MSRDPATTLFHRWIEELWDGPAESVRSTAHAVVSEDFVGHWPDMTVRGPEELAAVVGRTKEMIDDLSFAIEVEPFSDGVMVAGRWTGRGVLDGVAHRFVGNDILRFDGERFTEYWVATVTDQDGTAG